MNRKTIKKNLLFLILFSGTVNLWAIGPIDAIRTRYKEAADLERESFFHEVVCNVMYAAIGRQTTTIHYIFNEQQRDPEKDPYDNIFELVKVTVEYNVAASEDYRYEYLFNRKGELIFYYQKWTNPHGVIETRYYIQNGEGIKYIISKTHYDNPRTGDPDLETKTVESEEFDYQKKVEIKEIIAKSKKYYEHFRALIEIEQIK